MTPFPRSQQWHKRRTTDRPKKYHDQRFEPRASKRTYTKQSRDEREETYHVYRMAPSKGGGSPSTRSLRDNLVLQKKNAATSVVGTTAVRNANANAPFPEQPEGLSFRQTADGVHPEGPQKRRVDANRGLEGRVHLGAVQQQGASRKYDGRKRNLTVSLQIQNLCHNRATKRANTPAKIHTMPNKPPGA